MIPCIFSFQHLAVLFEKELSERCDVIVKGLAVIGSIYVTKKVVQTAIYCYTDFKTYGFAKLWKTPLHKYGSWAGKCCQILFFIVYSHMIFNSIKFFLFALTE